MCSVHIPSFSSIMPWHSISWSFSRFGRSISVIIVLGIHERGLQISGQNSQNGCCREAWTDITKWTQEISSLQNGMDCELRCLPSQVLALLRTQDCYGKAKMCKNKTEPSYRGILRLWCCFVHVCSLHSEKDHVFLSSSCS